MFRRSRGLVRRVSLVFEGTRIDAEEGETLAAALLAAGVAEFRRAVEDGSPRAPYCMIGNCFDCMVDIEGLGGRQACRERVRDGMVVHRHRLPPAPWVSE